MEEEEPSLSDVLALGGTQDDLELMKLDGKSKKGADVTSEEISKFINEIGLEPGKDYYALERSGIESNVGEDNVSNNNKKIKQLKKRKEMDKEEIKTSKNEKSQKKSKEKNVTMKAKSKQNSSSKLGNDSITVSDINTSVDLTTLGSAALELENKLLNLSVKPHDRVLVKIDSETPWYDEAQSDNGTVIVSQQIIEHLYSLANEIFSTEMKLYQQQREKKRGKDVMWLKTVLSSGTLNDKIAAITLLIQESPVHSLVRIDHFISMSKKKCKRECLLAIDHLKELFTSDILPEKRKLKYLKQRPLEELLIDGGHGQVSCDLRKLFLWYFEDQLKEKFQDFVMILKELLHDPISEIREKILGVVFDLLYSRPEQEQILLKLIVNKIGDPNKKLASKCILLLLKLLNHHVNMKLVVVREFENFLYRPNLLPKAQYYSICFLNQIILTPNDETLPQKLINLYFTFFKIHVERDEFDSKMLSALLTGVNRALPFTKTDIPSFEDHMTSMFKLVHVAPLSTSIQSLTLLYQIMERHQSVSARYYRALYQKILNSELSSRTGQQAMFLNLLNKSLKNDPELNRNKAFFKRVLQSCDYHMPHFVCACLVVISELLKHKPFLWPFVVEAQDMEDTKYKQLSNHREPLYEEVASPWELSTLTKHYHPSVRIFASQLTSGDSITYDGNPLTDFTVLNFLDHFTHKNPKQKKSDHGGSLMQPTTNCTGAYVLPGSVSELVKMKEGDDMYVWLRYMKREFEIHKLKYSSKDTNMTGSRRHRKQLSNELTTEKDNESNEDFANEFISNTKEKQSKKKQKEKKHKKEMSDSDGDYSYSDMSDDSDSAADDGEGKPGEDYDEDELEKLLLENLSSSEDEIDEGDDTSVRNRKRERGVDFESNDGARKRKRMKSVFASADEFANLLQETNEQQSASKATKWEASRSFSGNRRNTRGRGTRRKKKGNLGSYDNIKTRNYSTNRVSGSKQLHYLRDHNSARGKKVVARGQRLYRGKRERLKK